VAVSTRPVRTARPRLIRRRSPIAGFGIFTRDPIARHRRIIEYAGERISHAESARREQRHFARRRIWCFTVDRQWVRDASVGGNMARYINHACRPNCYTEIVGSVIWIRAGRSIRAGEELTYDYHTGGEAGIPCQCQPHCQTML